jgi:hypothetical protein
MYPFPYFLVENRAPARDAYSRFVLSYFEKALVCRVPHQVTIKFANLYVETKPWAIRISIQGILF